MSIWRFLVICRNAFQLVKSWISNIWRRFFVAPISRLPRLLAHAIGQLKFFLLRVVRGVLRRIWVFEFISSLVLLSAFDYLWIHLQSNTVILTNLPGFPSGLIPILAITNAISLLGANAYLARYNAFDKINEIFASVSKITTDNNEELNGHPRETKFARHSFYHWLGNRSSISAVELEGSDQPHFVRRPYWDGVWFFGSRTYNRARRCDIRTFLSFHELLISAIFVLRCVLKLRDENAALIKGAGTGSQGSTWFLRDLKTRESLLRVSLSGFSYKESIGLILTAENSTHYMFDEFRSQQEEQGWDEFRKLRFVSIFIEYLIWINYFQLKFLSLRVANAQAWFKKNNRKVKFATLDKQMEKMSDLKAKLFELRETVIPRKAIAEKISQIRLGSLIPIILTASALFGYAVFQPIALAFATSFYSNVAAAAVYSLVCTAMAENFVFGLWLLIPWKLDPREELLL